MKRALLILSAVLLLVVAGCKPRAKEITSLQRKEAAALVSEADFAVTLRDQARAEGLYAKAAALCPDNGDYWIFLGSTRVRLGRRDDARAAYQRALGAYEDAAARDPQDAQSAIQQVYVLALLGRVDDARARLGKLSAKYPDNPSVRSFVETKQLDRLLATPQFKQLAL